MEGKCFSAPQVAADGVAQLPFFEIFVAGCIVTWLIELLAESR